MSARPASEIWGQSPTGEVVDFIASTTFGDLPEEAINAAKFAILDTLAVAVAGVSDPGPAALADLGKSYVSRPAATLIGRSFRADPAWAALINGATAHALDYDDQSWTIGGHPSVTLLPALLALGEDRRLSGSDVLRGYIVGYEIAARLGRSINPAHYGHGWHATSTIGAVGAASAAASLLGFDRERAKVAVAIGASSGTGFRDNFGTDIKPYHAGQAARAGVMAAELAERGFTGAEGILETEFGFLNVFSPTRVPPGSVPRWQDAPGTGLLGLRWDIVDPGIATKLFPSCGATHPAIGSMLKLHGEGLRLEQVRGIEVKVVDITAGLLRYHRPQTGLEAKFSMEYCLAVALTHGRVALEHFDDDAVRSGSAVAGLPLIRMEVDPQLGAGWVWGTPRPTILTVTMTDGQVITERADLPPGSPGSFSREMLLTKASDCFSRAPVAGSLEDLVKTVENLEDCSEIGDLTSLVAGSPAA